MILQKKPALFFLSFSSLVFLGALSHAEQNDSDAQEKQDPLMREIVNDKEKNYGDSEIYIQTKGKRDDSQITPDDLVRRLEQKKEGDESQKKEEYKKIKEKISSKEELAKNRSKDLKNDKELVTPDPLLNTIEDR